MANVKDLLVNGSARVIGTIYGNATSADKLNTNAGSTSQPIYFSNGVPVAITGTLGNNISGNAASATKLQTARTINGTSFDGTANITTTNWGTARTLTIGNTGKSVNGSGNVSWTLSEIGAAAASHNHTSLTGVTSIAFSAQSSDSASIKTTIDGTATYFDFMLSDDYSNDQWRWRFSSSGGTIYDAMKLNPTAQGKADLYVGGTKVSLEGHTHNYAGSSSTGGAANSANLLNGSGSSSAIPTANVGAGTLKYYYNVNSGLTGNMPAVNNANGIIQLSKHGGDYNSQLGFSSNGNIYYRNFNGNAIDTTTPWKQIAFTDTKVNAAVTADSASSVAWGNISGKPSTFAPSSHTHNYAGSSTAGGSANSAVKLDSSAGSATQPIYFSGGKPVAITGAIANNISGNAATATHFENNAFRTKRDFINGTLITTDLSGGTSSSSVPFYLEIVGNGYGDGLVAAYCQGYVYNLGVNGRNQYINCDAYSTGKSFTNTIYAFSDANGKLCFWFARMAYWQGFDIKVYETAENSNTKKLINHVVSVSDVALPETRNWETQITVRQASFIGTGSIDSRYVKKTGDTMTGNLTAPQFNGSLNGNAASSTKLATARTINGTSFDGSANITTANWGTARTLTIGNTGKSINGSGNVTWTLSEIGAAAATHTHNYAGSSSVGGAATSANKLATARTIALTGSVTGSGSFDGSGNLSIATTTNHSHNYVVGSYTHNGGQQNPNYFGTNKVGFLMMNTTVNGNSDYKDWIIMDCYSGNDVGGGVALGVNRQRLGAYIMRSAAERTSWAEKAELLHTSNYTSYTVKKDGTGASGTWGINVTGSAGSIAWGNVTGKPSTFAPSSHTHDDRYYTESEIDSKLGGKANSSHTHSYLPLSGGTLTGSLTMQSSYIWIQGGSSAGGNSNRLGTTSGMPGNMQYNSSRRGTQIYSNGIAFADPYNGNGNNDACWIRHIEETANSGFMEIAVGDDSNESIYVRQYNTSNNIARSITLMDASGNSTFIKAYGAVWNDYAEYRKSTELEPGRCVIEVGDGSLIRSFGRLEPGAEIVSDTFGFAIGETDECKTPLAVSGRVLAYPAEDRESYKPGDAVCSGPNGTVSKMTRQEIREWPDRIIGTVSEIPNYETWGTGNVSVNGRIWIRIR